MQSGVQGLVAAGLPGLRSGLGGGGCVGHPTYSGACNAKCRAMLACNVQNAEQCLRACVQRACAQGNALHGEAGRLATALAAKEAALSEAEGRLEGALPELAARRGAAERHEHERQQAMSRWAGCAGGSFVMFLF